MKHTHVMVDLETLGTRPGCRILSIGAVVMLKSIEIPTTSIEFYRELDPNDQPGLTVDPATWAWWQEQDPAARDRLFATGGKPGLLPGLKEFGLWLSSVSASYKDQPQVCIWGNGADFDNAILQVAFAAAGLPQPWPFWNNRCYRTLKNLRPDLPAVRQGVHHNALDDARTQAFHALKLFDALQVDVHAL